MKRILLILTLLISGHAFGQLTGWMPYASKNKHIGLAADSLMYMPVKDTTHTPQRLGAYTMRPQDSCVYVGISMTVGTKRWDKLAKYSDLVAFGISGDTLYYDSNPSHWYTTKHQNNPTFPRAPAGDRSSYVPSGIQGTDGVQWVFVKGDTYPRITKFYSTNKGDTWTYDSVAIAPSPTYQDSIFNLEPYAMLVGDTVYLYYMGGNGAGIYDTHNFSIWQARCAYSDLGNNAPFIRQPLPIISNVTFDTLMGLGYETGYLALSSIVKKDSIYYYHGGFLTTGVDPRTRIWVGQGSTLNGITSAQQVSLPLDSALVGVKTPTVWKENDSYKMIFSKGDPYYNGGYLMTANSSDLINWTENPGMFAFPPTDTTLWDAKQIYSGQLMKQQSLNYDLPLLVYSDTLYAGTQATSMGYYTYLYSGSYDSVEYVDQSGIMRIHPQHSNLQFAVDDNGNHPYSVQRNTTTVFNLPKAGERKNGYLDSLDFVMFLNKADSSGQWSYIHNNATPTPQDASINIAGDLLASGSSVILGKLSVGSSSNPSTITSDAYLHSGSALTLKNSSNFGISSTVTVTDQITNLMTGTGIGYMAQSTSNTYGFREQFYRRDMQPVFYPFSVMATYYGQATDSTVVEFNSIRLPGNSVDHTDNGTTINVSQADGYNTTAAARTSYGGRFYNTASRASGSNDLTNIGIDARATGGQNNIALRTSGGNVQFQLLPTTLQARLAMIGTDGTLYSVDTTGLFGGGGSGTVYVDSVYINGSNDSLIVKRNGNRYASLLPAGSGGGWGLSLNSITAGTHVFGTSNNASLRIYTNNSLRAVFDSLGSILQGVTNTIHTNVKFHQRYGGTSSDYYWLADEPFNTTIHYMRGDGYAYHAGGVGAGAVATSTLTSGGSFGTKYTATATGITLDGTHCVVNVTATGQTITLPAAAGITGRQYTIKLTASGSCTVDGNASETIDGATTYSLASQYKYVTVVSDGTNWIVTANN